MGGSGSADRGNRVPRLRNYPARPAISGIFPRNMPHAARATPFAADAVRRLSRDLSTVPSHSKEEWLIQSALASKDRQCWSAHWTAASCDARHALQTPTGDNQTGVTDGAESFLHRR